MEKPNKLANICRSISQVMKIPLTVKMRMGYMDKKPVAHNIIPTLKDCGVSAVTVSIHFTLILLLSVHTT
jgi:tRNA-dihydrouridine synthase